MQQIVTADPTERQTDWVTATALGDKQLPNAVVSSAQYKRRQSWQNNGKKKCLHLVPQYFDLIALDLTDWLTTLGRQSLHILTMLVLLLININFCSVVRLDNLFIILNIPLGWFVVVTTKWTFLFTLNI